MGLRILPGRRDWPPILASTLSPSLNDSSSSDESALVALFRRRSSSSEPLSLRRFLRSSSLPESKLRIFPLLDTQLPPVIKGQIIGLVIMNPKYFGALVVALSIKTGLDGVAPEAALPLFGDATRPRRRAVNRGPAVARRDRLAVSFAACTRLSRVQRAAVHLAVELGGNQPDATDLPRDSRRPQTPKQQTPLKTRRSSRRARPALRARSSRRALLRIVQPSSVRACRPRRRSAGRRPQIYQISASAPRGACGTDTSRNCLRTHPRGAQTP